MLAGYGRQAGTHRGGTEDGSQGTLASSQDGTGHFETGGVAAVSGVKTSMMRLLAGLCCQKRSFAAVSSSQLWLARHQKRSAQATSARCRLHRYC